MTAIDFGSFESFGRLESYAEPRRSPRPVVDSAFLSLFSKWTVSRITCALEQHEQGIFHDSAQLCDAALRDAQVFAHLATRVSALSARSGLPFCIEPSEGVDDRSSEKVARDVQNLWWTMCPEAQVAALHRDGVMLGVGVGRIEWDRSSTPWVPRLRRLRPHGLYWDETTRCFKYIDDKGQTHVVTPGQNDWVLHLPNGPDSWLFGAIRPVALIQFARSGCTLRDWLRFEERHGMPALVVDEPHFASDDVAGTAEDQANAYYQQFRNLGKNPVIRQPKAPDGSTEKGWGVRWLELTSTSYEGFEKLLGVLRSDIITAILGRDHETASKLGGDGVSMLERVASEFLITDTEGLANTLRDCVLKPFVRFNYRAAKEELASWPRWQTRPQTDLKTRAETLKTASEALPRLEAMGIDVGPAIEELHLKRTSKPEPAQALQTPQAPAEEPEIPA